MGFLAVIPIGMALSIGFRRRFEEMAPVSVFLIILVLYISGIITTFTPGLIVIAVGCILATIYVGFKCLTDHYVLHYAVTAGFIGFCLFSLYFMVISYHRAYTDLDDFAHWGLAVKNMYLFNDFTNIYQSTDLMYHIPPADTLWLFFCTRIWVTFSESLTIVAQDLFIITILLAVFPPVCEKYNWKKSLIIWTIALYVPLIADKAAYTSLSVNALIGCLAVYILVNCFRYISNNNMMDLFSAVMGTVIISLLHKDGLYVIMILLAIMAIYVYFFDRQEQIGRKLFLVASLFFVAIVSFLSWQFYLYATSQVSGKLQDNPINETDVLVIVLTFLIAGLCVAVAVVFDTAFDKAYIYIMLCVLLLSNISQPFNLIKQRPEEKIFWGVVHSEISLKQNDRFYFIDESTKQLALNQMEFYYSITPARSDINSLQYAVDKSESALPDNEKKLYGVLQEGHYNYVYLEHVDGRFADVYSSLFQDPDTIGDGKLYKTEWNGNVKKMELVLIGE